MPAAYRNKWIPMQAQAILSAEQGSILDLGGGAAPFWKASHIIDIQPYDSDRLAANQWGCPDISSCVRRWACSDYTQADVCSCKPLPFEDKSYDLGLCSHVLEDLRDPVRVLTEMFRVCKKVMVISPSRLLEQTKGIEHPRYAGFYHHLWMIYEKNGKIIFRRKTPTINLTKCHFHCPRFKTITTEAGSFMSLMENGEPVEEMYWNEKEDAAELMTYVALNPPDGSMYEKDPSWTNLAFIIWKMRQMLFGVA